MKLSQPLQNHEGYSGLMRVNVRDHGKTKYSEHTEPAVWLEFQEGCGYDSRLLTIKEARAIAFALNIAADAAEFSFGLPMAGPLTMDQFIALEDQQEFYFQD